MHYFPLIHPSSQQQTQAEDHTSRPRHGQVCQGVPQEGQLLRRESTLRGWKARTGLLPRGLRRSADGNLPESVARRRDRELWVGTVRIGGNAGDLYTGWEFSRLGGGKNGAGKS